MNEPLISVLVPIYNRFNFLVLTLQSLKNQSYHNFEAICINDGGEDASRFIEELDDSRFRYFEHKINSGLPAARNTALKHANGSYISLLDSDDIYLKYALEMRMYYIQKLGVDVVYTRSLQNIMDKVQFSDGREGYQLVHQQLYWNSNFSRDQLLCTNIAPCCNVTFSRKSWEDSGYWYDEELRTGEDFDFWNALSRKYDFHNLEFIDAECSFRRDGTQMTGVRNFAMDLPRIFKRWRNTAIDLPKVTEIQNRILINSGLNPSDYNL